MLRVLRTEENEKFNRYFALIQAEAAKRGCVFFADAGDGRDIETDEFECEDMSGWLIPEEMADEFEPIFLKHEADDTWVDWFCFAEWTLVDGMPVIDFKFYE